MKQTGEHLVLSKANSWQMFNEISPRYDFLNHFLSFGLDIHWRQQMRQFLPEGSNLKIMDLASGTADVLIELCRNNKNIREGVGLDLAEKMLNIGRKKVHKAGLDGKIKLQKADAHQIPFSDNQFDAVTIAFGIRNMNLTTKVLQEMARMLKPGGRVIVLEFSLPANPIIRFLDLIYLRYIVPAMGFIFSRHYKAYKYLNQTIETFPYGQAFCNMLHDVGLKDAKAHTLMAGVASIYVAHK